MSTKQKTEFSTEFIAAVDKIKTLSNTKALELIRHLNQTNNVNEASIKICKALLGHQNADIAARAACSQMVKKSGNLQIYISKMHNEKVVTAFANSDACTTKTAQKNIIKESYKRSLIALAGNIICKDKNIQLAIIERQDTDALVSLAGNISCEEEEVQLAIVQEGELAADLVLASNTSMIYEKVENALCENRGRDVMRQIQEKLDNNQGSPTNNTMSVLFEALEQS